MDTDRCRQNDFFMCSCVCFSPRAHKWRWDILVITHCLSPSKKHKMTRRVEQKRNKTNISEKKCCSRSSYVFVSCFIVRRSKARSCVDASCFECDFNACFVHKNVLFVKSLTTTRHTQLQLHPANYPKAEQCNLKCNHFFFALSA